MSFFGVSPLIFAGLGVLFGAIGAGIIWIYPQFRARVRVVDSLSSSPLILAQLVSYLKLSPNVEWAITHATEFEEGFLRKVLRNIVQESVRKGRITDALTKTGLMLSAYSRGFKRCLFLVRASLSESNEQKRQTILDKSLSSFLDEVRRDLTEFSQRLVTPSLVVFSVGTIVPLALVSILPILNVFESSNMLSLIIGILGVLAIGIFAYTTIILMEKPVVVSKTHSIEGGFSFRALAIAVFAGAVIAFPGVLSLLQSQGLLVVSGTLGNVVSFLDTMPLILALGVSTSVYCFVTSRRGFLQWKKESQLDDELADVSYAIASELDNGLPFERAIKNASSGAGGFEEILVGAWKLVKNHHKSIEDAFFDKNVGVLRTVHSKRVNALFRFLSVAHMKGSGIVSKTLFAFHEHLMSLKSVEYDMQNKLSQSMGMIQSTAIFFAPAIGGLIVVLNQLIEGALTKTRLELDASGLGVSFFSFFGSTGISSSILHLIVGAYMLIFAVIMLRFSVFIMYGKDNNLLKHKLARMLPITVLIYALTVVIAKLSFGV
ncbi:hypothetical protein COT72_03110 [archaeon CG10_big_fil_rev_8_21_14_0_10_43_11]|nr:MAG: hypothetical protein COT72_03110 [archaeon CG10_big_fil_rev_8_21_14_0_10_43_11]